MADSYAEQIVAALKTRLAAIVAGASYGTTVTCRYNYTPSAVLRAPRLHSGCISPNVGAAGGTPTVYVLSPASEEVALGGSFFTRATVTIDLSLLRRVPPGPEDPFAPPTPDRWLVQNRMLQDVRGAILTDVTFGGLVVGLEPVQADRSTPDKTYIDGWAVVMARWAFRYDEGF